MMSQTISSSALEQRQAEIISSLTDILSAGLRQVTRGLCLGLIGAGVILSVAAVLIGAAELGVGTAGPPLPPGQILHR